MSDATGLAEALLGLEGFRVLEVTESPDELVISVETTATIVGCSGCGVRAEAQDRMVVDVRDLACFGRPARLRWNKRRWRCAQVDCEARTWTEHSPSVDAQAVLTRRAGAEACRQVGEGTRAVSAVAEELGVCWWTVMNAVIEHGTPLVDDPERIGAVQALGVDETTFLAARPTHRRLYATSLVDLDAKVIIDLIEGNGAADLQRWLRGADLGWLGGIGVVATDLAESFRAGLSPQLDHATRVADPFHVVRVANRCVDAVRRRVQNDTLGHRGRRDDPLYRIRKLLLTGDERLGESGRTRLMAGLRFGDPHDETLGAWLAKEAVRSVYLTEDPNTAAVLLDAAITGCAVDEVGEIRSLGATLERWRPEILAHHRTGASNGPTEGLNLAVKRTKRCGHGFKSFGHYRLRVLLHAGGVRWPSRPCPPRIRTRAPHSDA